MLALLGRLFDLLAPALLVVTGAAIYRECRSATCPLCLRAFAIFARGQCFTCRRAAWRRARYLNRRHF